MLHQIDSGRSKETDIARTLNRPNPKGSRRYLDGSWLGGVNKRGLADRGSKRAQSRNRIIASKSNRCASFFDGAENPQRLTRVVHDEQRRVRHNRVGNVEFLEVSEFFAGQFNVECRSGLVEVLFLRRTDDRRRDALR